jgi:hypothetical protein
VETSLTRDEGHAHVAAIRVLRFRLGRPPTLDEVAEILGSRPEITNHRLRKLAALGIIHVVENPFDVHLSVADHQALEQLPEEADESVLSDAVEDFKRRQAAKADELVRTFETEDEGAEKRQKHTRMADDLRSFQQKKTKKAPWEN